MKTGIVYCRVSTEKQRNNTSFERQFYSCKELATKKGILIIGVFYEVGSGADELPIRALAKAAALASSSVLLCEDYDRWSRKIENLGQTPIYFANDELESRKESNAKLLKAINEYVITRQ